MKYLSTALALVFFTLGVIGVFVPILPTTPFLLLATYFFIRGSERVQQWYLGTNIYKKYGNKETIIKHKYRILLLVSIWIIATIVLINNLTVQIILGGLLLIKTIYFVFFL